VGSNAFQTGARKAIPAVLVYVFDRSREGPPRVLMLEKPDGRWNGLGGKCEPDESFWATARREVREEAGLELAESAYRVLGFLQFPNFIEAREEDWLVTVLAAELPASERGRELSGPEGRLHWIEATRLDSLRLWPGDRHFLPYVLRQELFFGTLWYRAGELLRHEVRSLTGP
jgi:8-oxo-dGTP diphosphatase